MNDDDKERVRQLVDLVEVVGGYTTLKRNGSQFKGICPFHQEKTPSFYVNPERGTWRCFGACGEGGDLFKFVMKAEGLTFPEAMEKLAARAGITLTRRGMSAEDAARQSDEKTRVFNANAAAQRFFMETFGRAPDVAAYARKRGLAHETIQNFGVGFAPDSWDALCGFLTRANLRLDDAEKAGLCFPSRRGDGEFTDRFRGRLMFPIWDLQERIVGFGGRILEARENAPKYLNSPETPVFSKSRILYALNRARKSVQQADKVVVVEGYMDVVAAHQAGFDNVVATLGTSLTEEHVAILRRYTKNVVLSFDSDTAGVKAALKAATLFAAAGPEFSVRALALPAGDDPDSILARGDSAGFRRAIDDAISIPEFRLDTLARGFDVTDSSGRLAYLREALPVLVDVVSAFDLDVLVRRLAPFHPTYSSGGGRAEASIRAEVERYRRESGAPSPEEILPDAPQRPRPPFRPKNGNGAAGGAGSQNGYSQNGNGNGGYAARAGASGRGGWRDRFSSPTPQTEIPRAGASDAAHADERAERALLRALLVPSLQSRLRGKLPDAEIAALFVRAERRDLASALLSAQGDLSAQGSLARILQTCDDSVREEADHLVFDPDADVPLSDEVIDDCLEALARRRLRERSRQMQAQARTRTVDAEGNGVDENELLRRWQENARASKRGPDVAS